MLRWQTLDWVEEVRRRLVDAIGWMEFVMRQIVHHIALVASLDAPRWVTEGRFVGVMVDRYYKDAADLGEELAKLGAPVWEVSFAERNPPLELVPPGTTQKHPVWKQYYEDSKKNNPSTHPRSMSVRKLFQDWLQEMIALGHAAQPMAWFEPTENPPPERQGRYFVDPQSVPDPRMKSTRDSFLIHVLYRLRISKWLESNQAPALFEEDLSELERVFSPKVFNTSSQTTSLVLSPLFALNHKSLLLLRSLGCPSRKNPWEIKDWKEEYHEDIREPGAPERMIKQRDLVYNHRSMAERLALALSQRPTLLSRIFQETSPPSHSDTTPSSTSHARSESPEPPRQRPRLASDATQEPASLEPQAFIPSMEECVQLGLKASGDPQCPETWSRRYGDKGTQLHLVDPDSRNYTSRDFHQLDSLIYVCLEDYVNDGPPFSLAAQLYDRYSSTGAVGYLISLSDDRVNVMLAYPASKESNALAVIDNQTKASLQFPHSEPSCTRPAFLHELGLAQRISPWGNLATEAQDRVLARQHQRLEYFQHEIHEKSLPEKWSLNLLGPREDGRKELYGHLEFELGVILPPMKAVTKHFFEGPMANYPKGSKFIVMERFRIPSMDFYLAIKSAVQRQQKGARLPLQQEVAKTFSTFLEFLHLFLSSRTPPSFQIPIPHSGPFRAFLSSVARFHEPSKLSSRVNASGTYADEMLIFAATREEFEVVLCGFDSMRSLKAQGRASF